MPKHYLLLIDDGHGMETAGKRTPIFPVGHIYAGTFMHENEFNDAVADNLELEAKRCEVPYTLLAPTNTNTPLDDRCALADKKYEELIKFYGKENVVCILVSIHANANTGVWGDWGGIDTFFNEINGVQSTEGRKLATLVHKHMIKGTPLRDRGVKGANFQILRETKMPAILVECAFMDNLEEASLLKSHAYRKECAQEIMKGVCEYMGLPYVPEPQASIVKTVTTTIEGKAVLTAQQMGDYVLKNNPSPKIQVDAYALAQLYLDEGAIEGLRGDIAFCQACHETGFFKYGGQVLPEQNNYCGLGATNMVSGKPVPRGATFATPQIGVRAHIHHLRGYNSKEPLKTPCQSPRYSVLKSVGYLGIAKYWEDLNGRWAVPGPTYGQSIYALYQKMAQTPVRVIEAPKEEPPVVVLPKLTLNDFLGELEALIKKYKG